MILIGLALLYNRYLHKLDAANPLNEYEAIQKYLLTDETFYDTPDRDTKLSYLADNSAHYKFRPILWIHLEYVYNSRHWVNFGSRSSHHLNQPLLFLTIKTIIDQCKDSFRICIIDDDAFFKLLPNWSVHLNKVGDPIQRNLRFLACLHLLDKYGGILVPPSFLCMRNLIEMYEMGTGDKYLESALASSHLGHSSEEGGSSSEMFLVETPARNVTSSEFLFAPDTAFMGAKKGAPVLHDLIDFVQRTASSDHSEQTKFLGEFSRWCLKRVRAGKIKLIGGKFVGVKTLNDDPVLVDDWMKEQHLELYTDMFGILIPTKEIMARVNYQWFTRLSQEQLLSSNIVLCRYIVLACRPDNRNATQNFLGLQRETTSSSSSSSSFSSMPSSSWMDYWQVPSKITSIFGYTGTGANQADLSKYLIQTQTTLPG